MAPSTSRKRRADPSTPPSSPEPTTQRRRVVNDDEADAPFGGDAGTGASGGNTDQMVKKLVRLALACEHNRRAIRRDMIREKVLGAGATGSKLFKQVLEQAQVQLRSVFGMELMELPSREKVTAKQRRAAQKTAEKSKTTDAWLLVTTLPAQYRNPAILAPSSVPTAEEEAKYTAIYTLFISVVMFHGGTLPDMKMERYLRRLGLEDNTPLDHRQREGRQKTEELIKRLSTDNYVYKVREATGMGEDEVYWVVGPRGKLEVGDEGVRGLARAVYGEQDEADEEELERRMGKSLGLAEAMAPRKAGVEQNGEKKRRKGRPRKQQGPEEEEQGEEGEGDGDTEEDEE